MAGKSSDPKRTRITVRLADDDLKALKAEAGRRDQSIGAIVRDMIRVQLNLSSAARRSAKG
jgi:predicted DNA binding CopG/RHH family protein